MRSTIHVILFAILLATLHICVSQVGVPIKDGNYIYWLGLFGACLGPGAQALQLIYEIREDLSLAESMEFNQTTFEGR